MGPLLLTIMCFTSSFVSFSARCGIVAFPSSIIALWKKRKRWVWTGQGGSTDALLCFLQFYYTNWVRKGSLGCAGADAATAQDYLGTFIQELFDSYWLREGKQRKIWKKQILTADECAVLLFLHVWSSLIRNPFQLPFSVLGLICCWVTWAACALSTSFLSCAVSPCFPVNGNTSVPDFEVLRGLTRILWDYSELLKFVALPPYIVH